ncbi:hypothetical protein [Novosphingobium mathurense]|uniref:hypothetical protein n=1 Tax=Novosphingobium mathurense TaxID=428990 RepID=UPI0009A90055|nr:hypothetical protein [Novosphingobium mathurense]
MNFGTSNDDYQATDFKKKYQKSEYSAYLRRTDNKTALFQRFPAPAETHGFLPFGIKAGFKQEPVLLLPVRE